MAVGDEERRKLDEYLGYEEAKTYRAYLQLALIILFVFLCCDWNEPEKCKNRVEVVAVIAGGWLFFKEGRGRKRIQFEVDCKAHAVAACDYKILELLFSFENKGLVELKLFDLCMSAHTVASDPKTNARTGSLQFKSKLMPSRANIVPSDYGFFFVRPGIRQQITHVIKIPADVSVVQVIASFNYKPGGQFPHTVRRVFTVNTDGAKALEMASM